MGNNLLIQEEDREDCVFSKDELRLLYENFTELDQDKSGLIEPDEFFDLDEIKENPIVKRVISVFDKNQDGKISFWEFILGLSVLTDCSVNRLEKLKFAFQVYDTNGDGYFDDYTMHWCSEDSKVIDMTMAKAKEYFPKNKIICRSRADNGFLEMGISSKDLIDWLKSIGFDRSLKAKNKVIPDSILQINEQKMAALISGIFSADGYCSILKDKRYSNSKAVKLGLKNTSIELLRQVKMLLNNLRLDAMNIIR